MVKLFKNIFKIPQIVKNLFNIIKYFVLIIEHYKSFTISNFMIFSTKETYNKLFSI